MDIPKNSDFQPTAETLNTWLATRKPRLRVGGSIMPGLFSDTGGSMDFNWLLVAILGEIVGFVTVVGGGISFGGQFATVAILGSIMFIFLDFFFAKKLHRNKGKHCWLESRLVLERDENERIIAQLEKELKKGRLWDYFFMVGIILIAILKVLAIFALGVFNSLILYFPIFIIFLIVGYVHINHTWYYVSYKVFHNRVAKDFSEYSDSSRSKGDKYKAREVDQIVGTPYKLRNLPIRHFSHEIIEAKEGDTEIGSLESIDNGNENKKRYLYQIKTKGVLEDDDIMALISDQITENRIELFKACRKIQLDNFPTAAL